METDTEHRRLLNELNSLDLRTVGGLQMKKNTLYDHFRKTEEFEAKPKSANAPPPKDPNKVITKEEAKKLRESANRPLNPWFSASDVRSDSSRSNLSASPSTTASEVKTTSIADSVSYEFTKKEVSPQAQSEHTIPIKMSEIKSITKPMVASPNPAQTVIPRLNYTQTLDFSNLKELSILESESRERELKLERQKMNNTDGRSSTSTFYFSDDGFDNIPKFCDIYVQKSKIPRCDMCFGLILQALGKTFHPHCFRCLHCNKCLDGFPFAVDGVDRVYCVEDYEKLFVPLCGRCHEPIKNPDTTGQVVRVQAMNREYHVNCYCCESCGAQLTNEYHRRCYPLNEHLLCMECNQRWRRNGGPLTDL